MVRAATNGKVQFDILSPAGATAIRLLAGVLVEEKGCSPQAALDEIQKYIKDRIGDRSEWLNSLRLVAIRIVGSAAGGEQGLLSYTRAMLDELRADDVNQIIDPNLFKQTRRFKSLCTKYGDEVVDVVRAVIAEAMVDGKAAGSIKTWDYFRQALEDERLKRQMAHEGIHPGDVFGLHRDLSERDESD